MTDFGGKLRQAREGRGISLRQIAASTKISVAALEALERNDISKLPGGIFSRSFVRSYAAEVGLDPDETVREFLERFQAEPLPDRGPVVHVPDEEIAFEERKQRAARIFLIAVAAMIVVAAVLVYVLLRNRPGAETPAEAAGATMITPAEPPASGTPAAVPPAAAPAAAEATAPAPAGDVIRIALHPTGPCWVSVDVDGKRVLTRVMEPGERETLTVSQSAVITVGDAGAFAYTINGRPGRSLGGGGEVKTARITRENLADYVR